MKWPSLTVKIGKRKKKFNSIGYWRMTNSFHYLNFYRFTLKLTFSQNLQNLQVISLSMNFPGGNLTYSCFSLFSDVKLKFFQHMKNLLWNNSCNNIKQLYIIDCKPFGRIGYRVQFHKLFMHAFLPIFWYQKLQSWNVSRESWTKHKP